MLSDFQVLSLKTPLIVQKQVVSVHLSDEKAKIYNLWSLNKAVQFQESYYMPMGRKYCLVLKYSLSKVAAVKAAADS